MATEVTQNGQWNALRSAACNGHVHLPSNAHSIRSAIFHITLTFTTLAYDIVPLALLMFTRVSQHSSRIANNCCLIRRERGRFVAICSEGRARVTMRKGGLIRPRVWELRMGKRKRKCTWHIIWSLRKGNWRNRVEFSCSVDECGPGGRTALRATAWYDFFKEKSLIMNNVKGCYENAVRELLAAGANVKTRLGGKVGNVFLDEKS